MDSYRDRGVRNMAVRIGLTMDETASSRSAPRGPVAELYSVYEGRKYPVINQPSVSSSQREKVNASLMITPVPDER